MLCLKMASFPIFLIWILFGTNQCFGQETDNPIDDAEVTDNPIDYAEVTDNPMDDAEGMTDNPTEYPIIPPGEMDRGGPGSSTEEPFIPPGEMNRGGSGDSTGTGGSDSDFELDVNVDLNIPKDGPKSKLDLDINVGGQINGEEACYAKGGRMVGEDCITYGGSGTSNGYGKYSFCSAHCTSKGGKVPEPTNLITFMTSYRTVFSELKSRTFWLSATDAAEEGVWKWPSGKKLSKTDPNWASSSYPRTNKSYQCLRAYGSSTHTAYLVDYSCNSNMYCVCQH